MRGLVRLVPPVGGVGSIFQAKTYKDFLGSNRGCLRVVFSCHHLGRNQRIDSQGCDGLAPSLINLVLCHFRHPRPPQLAASSSSSSSSSKGNASCDLGIGNALSRCFLNPLYEPEIFISVIAEATCFSR